MSDINELYTQPAHDEGAPCSIKDQFGKVTDILITVVGQDSKIWRKLDSERNRNIVNAILQKANSDKVNDAVSFEAEAMAKATVGWSGISKDGEPYEFSYERAIELYKNAPYIVDQLDRFIAKRANFIKG